jgi:hypothetical protein
MSPCLHQGKYDRKNSKPTKKEERPRKCKKNTEREINKARGVSASK